MNYPTEYWTEHLRYWWGTLGALGLLGVASVISINRGELLIGFIFSAIFCLVFYYRILCVAIPARSLFVRKGKVVEICMQQERRMIWDPSMRGKRIVRMMCCEELIELAYKSVVVFPAQGYQVCVCTITVKLGYIMHEYAWQRFYDNLVMRREGISEVRSLMARALEIVRRPPIGISGEKAAIKSHVVSPITNALNEQLKSYGLVACVDCEPSFAPVHAIPWFYAETQRND